MKILIVDDEKAIVDELYTILQRLNYDCARSYSPEDAIQKFLIENYALAICDLKMPKIDGIQLVEKLANINPKSNFFLISGNYDSKSVTRALNNGIDILLHKPLNIKELLTYIQKVEFKANFHQEIEMNTQHINKVK